VADSKRMETALHRPLCTIELIAEGSAERCPGDECPFWETGCVLDKVEHELTERREVAAFLLGLRRTLQHPELEELDAARAAFHRRLAAGRE
jgi:hypothetical protein